MPILDKLSVLFNIKDSPTEKREKLFKACENHELAAVNTFIAENPDAPQWKDSSGMTALMVAARFGHHSIVEALIDAGAKMNEVDNNNVSAMGHAAFMGQQSIVKKLIGMGAVTGGTDGGRMSTYEIARREGKTQIMQMIEDAVEVQRNYKREQLGGRIEVMKPLSLRSFKPAA